MPAFICATCGVEYAPSEQPPTACAICQDERQYINAAGQQWTTLDELRSTHHNIIREHEPWLHGIGTEPKFAIGQRALLIETPAGNILWDCISLIDEETVSAVQARGRLIAIAISHPHFYSSMVNWSRAFGNVPIYLHEDDKEWAQYPDPALKFWSGEKHILIPGINLIRCGGHFPGSTVLHWASGAEGRGVLLTGDTIQVVPDRNFVSFMYSYPNQIPLNAPAINRITKAIDGVHYDRLYGGWFESVIENDAAAVVARSAARYIQHISG